AYFSALVSRAIRASTNEIATTWCQMGLGGNSPSSRSGMSVRSGMVSISRQMILSCAMLGPFNWLLKGLSERILRSAAKTQDPCRTSKLERRQRPAVYKHGPSGVGRDRRYRPLEDVHSSRLRAERLHRKQGDVA